MCNCQLPKITPRMMFCVDEQAMNTESEQPIMIILAFANVLMRCYLSPLPRPTEPTAWFDSLPRVPASFGVLPIFDPSSFVLLLIGLTSTSFGVLPILNAGSDPVLSASRVAIICLVNQSRDKI